MQYSVGCECGVTHSVSAFDAGTRINCVCRRELTVPSLSVLKASVGQSTTSADVRIEQMLERGMLPEEQTCRFCRRTTTGVAHCWATCERAIVDQPTGWEISAWTYLSMMFGGFVFRKKRQETVEGRDVQLRLPIRVCPNCVEQLRDKVILKQTLLDVPVYAELFDRYPEALLSLDVGVAGLTRRESS